MNENQLRFRIRGLLIFFIAALAVSGLTAFPLEYETRILDNWIGEGTAMADSWPGLASWVSFVHEGVRTTYDKYPFMGYGTDWLAFAHLVISLAFVGPWRDPVKNKWVIQWGMMACVGVLFLALICGSVREIPIFWRLIDCSFGVFGIVPLWVVLRDIRELEMSSLL